MTKDAFYYTDCNGERWVDGGGLYSQVPQPCTHCLENTHRLDIVFEAYICTVCEPIVREAYFTAIYHG